MKVLSISGKPNSEGLVYTEHIPIDKIDFWRIVYEDGELTCFQLFRDGEGVAEIHHADEIDNIWFQTIEHIV